MEWTARDEPLVLPLAQLSRSSTSIAGGKAANLGELLRAGFPVPDGVCVTVAAYRRVVDAGGIGPRLDELRHGLDAENAESLATTGTAIRALFYQASIPEEISAAVISAARTLDEEATHGQDRFSREVRHARSSLAETRTPSWQPLAVRSSATAEDLPEASFAGQQETYLNVVGEQALMEAVRRCWGSLWTDRAILYRHRNDIPLSSGQEIEVDGNAGAVYITAEGQCG